MQETTITPHSGLASIKQSIASIRTNAHMTKELAGRMFLRDIRAMYRQSILGYLWIVLPPLANSLAWIYLNSQNVVNIDSGKVPYPIFVLTGNLLWLSFNGMLTGMLSTVSDARGIISKVYFPHEALLLSSFGKCAVNTLIPFALLLPVLPFYLDSFNWSILLFPLGVILILMLAASIAILLLPLATLFNDVSRGISFFLRFLFFLTPVVYPMPTEGFGKVIASFNPLAPLLVTTRSWLVGDGPVLYNGFVVFAIAIPLILLTGIIIYKISIPFLVERLSS